MKTYITQITTGEKKMKTLKTLVIVALVLGMAASAHAIKVHQRMYMMTNTIEAAQSMGLVETNLNQLTTVADGTVAIDTDGVMFINHTGVWQRVSGSPSATNQVLADAKAYTDLATNAVGVTWDSRWVNQSGDTMSGDLDMGNNNISNVNYLSVNDLYAENETVINIVVSNTALVTTSLTVQSELDMTGHNITNLAAATRGDMAVNYNQLTNQISNVQGDLTTATNQVLNDANNYTVNYTDAATNGAVNTSINYTISATNAVLNSANDYTDSATNTLMNDAAVRFVDAAGDDMTGILGMGGNTITNLGPATEGHMAVNYDQLTNATHNSSQDLNGATNQVLIDAEVYTDSATNAVGTTWDNRWVNQNGDTMSGSLDMSNNDISNVNYLAVKDLYAENETIINIVVSNTALVTTSLTVQGVIDVTGHNITNLAAATRGDMAVNYDQLTNQIGDVQGDLTSATNQVLNDANNYTVNYTDAATNGAVSTSINYTDAATNSVLNTANNYTDSATNNLMNDADAHFVNAAGDVMTGILDMGGNRITNVANAVNPQDAITKSQLDAATNSLAGNINLQDAYENGNTIATSAGEGDVTIAGTEGLNVSSSGGIGVTGGDLQVLNGNNVSVDNGGSVKVNHGGNVEVDGANGGQVNVDGNTGNESIRLNSSGKMVIYSGGSLALEFE